MVSPNVLNRRATLALDAIWLVETDLTGRARMCPGPHR
jgi:hypothetical protein